MMRLHSMLPPLALAVSLTATGAAQQAPPVRMLGAAVALSTEPFSTIVNVREVPGGAVFVNDMVKRRLLLLDPTLKTYTVVADSTSNTSNAYGSRGGLIAYRGDSTLFIDASSLSMLVIDSHGKIVRTASVPRSQDIGSFIGPNAATAGFDPSGKLVYRSNVAQLRPMMSPTGTFMPPAFPDSAMLVRVDLATRKVDTLAYFKIPKISMTVTSLPNGGMSMINEINPLPVTDDIAVLSNGTALIVRGQDYHVDVVAPNGTITPSPKIPFEWQRLTDDEKVAFIDSVKTAMDKARASGNVNQTVTTNGGPVVPAGVGGGDRTQVLTFMGGGRGEGGGRGGDGGGVGGMQMNMISPSQLPDYKPAFGPGALRPDADGNLWVRTNPTKPLTAGPIYDVINSRGELIDRVQVPASRTIVGFGPGGTVYLAVRESNGLLLEKARLK